MIKKLNYVFFAMMLMLLIIGVSSVMAYSQTGPTTVCTTAQLDALGISIIDAPFSTQNIGGTQYWYHTQDWGQTSEKFTGTLDAPCGSLVWSKSKAQLYTNTPPYRPWIISTYKDTAGLLGFVHVEFAGSNGQKGRTGLAWSTNNGDTWTYLGEILSPYGDPDMTGGFMIGVPYFIKDGYFYIYYNESATGINVARSLVTSVISAAQSGTTSTWYKYYNGNWTEAGLGGQTTALNISGITHSGAAYSTYTGKYYLTLTMMTWGGQNTWLKLFESTDGITWSLTGTLAEDTVTNVGANNGNQNANIVGTDGNGSGTVGQQFYVYCAYKPYDGSNKIMRRWTIDLGGPTPTPTPVPSGSNLAIGKSATMTDTPFTGYGADKTIDGTTSTYAQTTTATPWDLTVDLGSNLTFNQVIFRPESNQYATSYTIKVATSAAPTTWTTVATETAGVGTTQTYNFSAVSARYVKLDVTAQHVTGGWGHAVHELEIYNTSGATPTPTPTPTPGDTKVDDLGAGITYSGTWSSTTVYGYYLDSVHYSNTSASYVQYTFTGTSIAWIGAKNTDHGKVDVYIDNVLDTSALDTYNSTYIKQQLLYRKTGLSNASHTIKIVLRSDKNASSSGYYTDVDAFEYNAGGGTSYRASAGFSSTQATNNWSYSYWNGSAYTNMTWDSANSWWSKSGTYSIVGSSWQHPDTSADSVRKFTAPTAGTITITGTVKKGDLTGGDGVNVKILKGTTQIWPTSGWQFIAYNDAIGYAVNVNTTVAVNDVIYFIINKNSTNSYDVTAWDPIIFY